ncbi:unnamed protein product [Mortierella alpina]
MFKIKSFHRSQAQKAIANKGLDMLISQADIHHYHGAGAGSRPLFVIEDGEFGRRGQVLYKKYIILLKKKLSALGVELAWADEYLTSQVCCQCGALGTLIGRQLVCTSCGTRDMDHYGSHNIARATIHFADHRGPRSSPAFSQHHHSNNIKHKHRVVLSLSCVTGDSRRVQ